MRMRWIQHCLLGLLLALPLQAQSHSTSRNATGSGGSGGSGAFGGVTVVSMPVECEVRLASEGKDWNKKTTEHFAFEQLPAGEYQIIGRYAGRTITEKITVKPGQSQTVFLNFLAKQCRHKTSSHIAKHRILAATKNDVSRLAYRVATPRQRLSFSNAFSTK